MDPVCQVGHGYYCPAVSMMFTGSLSFLYSLIGEQITACFDGAVLDVIGKKRLAYGHSSTPTKDQGKLASAVSALKKMFKWK